VHTQSHRSSFRTALVPHTLPPHADVGECVDELDLGESVDDLDLGDSVGEEVAV
jgi:hypothetical protein